LNPWRWVTTFFSSTRGAAAGLVATGFAATGFRVAFGAVFAGAFEATVFAAAFATVLLAVLGGIALLLFFEDFAAAPAFAVRESRARPLDALRLAAAAFLEGLEALFLRVFCDTACARNCHAPVRWFFTEAAKRSAKLTDPTQNVPYIAHFPEKSMV
jgi:hypothetical protein